MPRMPRLLPLVAPFAVALLLAGLIVPATGRAQEQPDPAPTVGAQQPTQRPKRVAPGEEGLLLFAVVEELPAAPAFVRLLRINLEPGAVSPLHFHPGPEMGLVENGVSTVRVEGPADLLPRGRTKPVPAEEGAEFELGRGDQILYRLGSPMEFRNDEAAAEVTTILTAVILPAGHQHPPGLTYVDGPQPALQGVTSFVLGDGIATALPAAPASVAIERLVIDDGEPIPAFGGPAMLSIESGSLNFTTVSGETQVSRAATPGPQPAAEVDTEFTLAPGDAAFFPTGLVEVARPAGSGELTLLRLTIAPAPPLPGLGTPAATPVAVEIGEPAVIESSAAAPPTPEPTLEPEPTEPAPETTPGDAIFPVGTVVETNDVGVNLRSEPTTASEVVAVLDVGTRLTIVGDPVEADGIVWYPVAGVDDPTASGWIAGQFLQPVSE